MNGTGGSQYGTLADAYANPIMVDALIHAREATVVPTAAALHAPKLPLLGVPQAAERWEPWVRAYIAVGELLEGITVEKTPTGATVKLAGTGPLATVGRPQAASFRAQIPLVLSWAELRYERATEILAQIDAQYAFWSSVVYMHPSRTRRSFELINLLLQLCVYVEMRVKHLLACWRPVEYSAQVQPMITTPGHGAFPSGHATQAHAVARLLPVLLGLQPAHADVVEQLDRQAARIATNRVVAGVHFPFDSMAGRMLGHALAEHFLVRCGAPGVALNHRVFNAGFADAQPQMDFNPYDPAQALGGNQLYTATAYTAPLPAATPVMQHLWQQSAGEWAGQFA